MESIKHFLWPAPSLRGWVRNQSTATPNAVEEPKVVPKPKRPQTCRGEGAHAKRPNSSRIRAHAKQNAPMRSFRKPRTAASFVPTACKTQARKKASQKRCVRNLSTWCRKTAGNGSKKAKRHYKPSSGKPKTMRSQPFHTVPKLQLRSRKKKHR